MNSIEMSQMASLVLPSSNVIASNLISQKDTDDDSSISLEELGSDKELFSSYDLDSNELLSKSELTTAIDSMMSDFKGEMPTKEEFQELLSNSGFEIPNSAKTNSLSTSQLDTISSVLSKYDSNNLSKADAKEIVAAFSDARIEPSEEFASILEEAGFSAQEIGTLAGVAGQAQAGSPPSGGGSGGGSSSSEEEYDAMDLNQDGVVSSSEIAEYYGLDTETSNETSSNDQNTSDNLQFLMEMSKSNSDDGSVVSSDFNGLLRTINDQNNNSQINTYLENSNTSTIFDYA